MYDDLTDEVFDNLLKEIIDQDNVKPSQLLNIPGIYEILREEYNNDVLEKWEQNNETQETR